MNIKIINLYFLFAAMLASCGGSGSVSINDDNSGRGATDSALAADGNRVYAAYYDAGNKCLRISRSLDAGRTWKPTDSAAVDRTRDAGHDPSMAVDGSTVYVSYIDSKNSTLKFARSPDGGVTWKAEDTKIVDRLEKGRKFNSIAFQGDCVYIAYTNGLKNEVKFAVSRDRGTTWKPGDIRIVDGSAVSKGGWYPSIAAFGNSVYLAYNGAYHGRGRGKSLKFAMSADRGASWKPGDIREIEGPECSLGQYTSIAVSGNNIFVSYTAKGRINVAVSRDSGRTWPASDNKTVEKAEKIPRFGFSSLAVCDNILYLTYKFDEDLKFAVSYDSGSTWDKDNVKTIDPGAKTEKEKRGRPREQRTGIATSGPNVWISYYDGKSKKLKVARSSDRGKTWNEN